MRSKYELQIVSKKDLRGISKGEKEKLKYSTASNFRCNSALGPLKLQMANLDLPK